MNIYCNRKKSMVNKNSHQYQTMNKHLSSSIAKKQQKTNRLRDILLGAAVEYKFLVSAGSQNYVVFEGNYYHKKSFREGDGYFFLLYAKSATPIACSLVRGSTELTKEAVSAAINQALLQPMHNRSINLEFA